MAGTDLIEFESLAEVKYRFEGQVLDDVEPERCVLEDITKTVGADREPGSVQVKNHDIKDLRLSDPVRITLSCEWDDMKTDTEYFITQVRVAQCGYWYFHNKGKP